MPTAKKTAAKKPKKNSSHLPKRARFDAERWAVTYLDGMALVLGESITERQAKQFLCPGGRVILVRITEVTK